MSPQGHHAVVVGVWWVAVSWWWVFLGCLGHQIRPVVPFRPGASQHHPSSCRSRSHYNIRSDDGGVVMTTFSSVQQPYRQSLCLAVDPNSHPPTDQDKQSSSSSSSSPRGYQFGDLSKSLTKKAFDYEFGDMTKSLFGSGKNDTYQFGDISRWLDQQAKSKVNELTGKSTYEFGDISRWLDQQAKDKVNQVTGKSTYEFGDLSRWTDQQIKDRINKFTGKDDYKIGDISKEVLMRALRGEYELADMIFVLKIIVAAGANFTPLGSMLPMKFLVEVLDVSIVQEIGGRLTMYVARSIDARMKEALLGDRNYELGDKTKETLKQSLTAFTGKAQYEIGDLTKAFSNWQGKQPMTNFLPANSPLLDKAGHALRELNAWDKSFLTSKLLK